MLPLEKWNSFLGLIHINCTRNSEVYSSCLFCIIWCKFYKAICFGFVDVSPDFLKRKTLTHHFFVMLSLPYHPPCPRGVPFFASLEPGSLALGATASALSHTLSAPVITGAGSVQVLGPGRGPGENGQGMSWGRQNGSGSPPCLAGFRVLSSVLLLCLFFGFVFTSHP